MPGPPRGREQAAKIHFGGDRTTGEPRIQHLSTGNIVPSTALTNIYSKVKLRISRL